MKKYLKGVFVLIVLFVFVNYVSASTDIDEIRLTSSTTSVNAGVLSSYEASTSTLHASVEEFGSNTTWAKMEEGHSSWNGFDYDTPVAINDGKTKYALRIRIILDDGYSFNSETKVYFNDEDVTNNGNTEINTFSWGGYVYIDLGEATGENINVYTVSFNTDGGNKIDAITIEKGTVLNNLPTPTKEGYTFINWFLDDKEFNIENIINNNITLTSKWKKINYGTFNEDTLKLAISTYSELENKLGVGEWINTNVCKPYNSVIGRIYYTSTYIKYSNGYYAVFNYSTKEGDDYKENIKTQKPSHIEFLRAKDIFNDYTDELINDDNKLKDIGATNFEYYPERNFKRFSYGQYTIDIHERANENNDYSKDSLVDIVPIKD